ncbi:unnamed protein product [Chironomus riparius]|uniref:Uncharacterized protein n=1 Tax=Chironomus riparius TaxID=315576 RepID=A0A9N9S4W1_9DIPT|nr:unnamed protein product [Chironomus riparius]
MSEFKLQFIDLHLTSKEVTDIFITDEDNSLNLGPFKNILCEKFSRNYDLLVTFESEASICGSLTITLSCIIKNCRRKYRLVIPESNVFKNTSLSIKVLSNNHLCHHKGVMQAFRKWESKNQPIRIDIRKKISSDWKTHGSKVVEEKKTRKFEDDFEVDSFRRFKSESYLERIRTLLRASKHNLGIEKTELLIKILQRSSIPNLS